MNSRKVMLLVFITIFFLSGFSGLIYESIWSHYLKLFLGHASYAQVLVLVIFMGGMAIGAGLAAKFSKKITNLILWYGIVECVIGLFGITFHQLFTSVQATTFNHIIPGLGSYWLVHTVKWLLASLMILPQSILLGATFPLLTAGIIRRFSDESSNAKFTLTSKGKIIATFYFVNSLGASIGILFNTFVLIPSVGLPGSVLTAGLANIVLAILVYGLSKKDYYPEKINQSSKIINDENTGVGNVLLIVAAFTGLASFMYEIGWIRMLTMVLGASTHSFELMLSAFIFGLALGGLWIRKRIEGFTNPVRVLAIIQLIMGSLAALTIPLYNYSYELMDFIVKVLNRSEDAYLLYTTFSYVISLLIMLPATFCAGTTLPLVTAILLNEKASDAVIGKVYAWNTVGSIIGVALAVQFVMPLFGLKWVILGGASVDLLLGAYLLYRTKFFLKENIFQSCVVLVCLAIILCFPILGLDTTRMASGVFRFGLFDENTSKVIFHRDGKTSTVAVKVIDDTYVLMNNGKPDAGLIIDSEKKSHISPDSSITDDQPTMVLLGTLPYVYQPEAKTVANIGLGSGLTAHTLLHSETLERLDSIEIEEAVFEAAEKFRPSVENIFIDNRSSIILEDAKTYFSASGNTYDVIVSEPPNPWVSGVSSLFSVEFYQEIKRYMNEDGVFVQWMHIYEISPYLISTIYLALNKNFSDIHFYQVSRNDIAIVASNRQLKADYTRPFFDEGLKEELSNININSANDIEVRKLAGKDKLDIVFTALGENYNSDYFPILDHGASKSRFLNSDASDIYMLDQSKVIDRLINNTRTIHADLTEDTRIKAISAIKQTSHFYDLFQEYKNGHISLNIATTPAETYFKEYSALLQLCGSSLNKKENHVASNKLFNITYWLSDYLEEEKLKEIYEYTKECENIFDTLGKTWIDINIVWLNKDYEMLYLMTNEYIKQKKNLSGIYDQEILLYYLASRFFNKIKDKDELIKIKDKINVSMKNNLELNGVLNFLLKYNLK